MITFGKLPLPFSKLNEKKTCSNDNCNNCKNNKWIDCIHFLPFLLLLLSSCSLLYITANPDISSTKENRATMYKISGSRISAKIVDSNKAVTIYFAMSNSHLPNSFFMCAKLRIFFQSSKYFIKNLVLSTCAKDEIRYYPKGNREFLFTSFPSTFYQSYRQFLPLSPAVCTSFWQSPYNLKISSLAPALKTRFVIV